MAGDSPRPITRRNKPLTLPTPHRKLPTIVNTIARSYIRTGSNRWVERAALAGPEAKPDEHKLSNESPVGRALLGHKRNDIVAVKVPRGPARKLKITKIDVGLE